MRSCRTSCLGHGRRGSPGMPAAQPSVLRAPLMHRRCCRRAPREPRAARPLHASPAWVRRWPGEAQLRGSSARLQMCGPLWPRRRPDGFTRVLRVLHAPACGAPVAAAHARATRPPASGHAPPPTKVPLRALSPVCACVRDARHAVEGLHWGTVPSCRTNLWSLPR